MTPFEQADAEPAVHGPESCSHGPLISELQATVDALSTQLAQDPLTGAASRTILETAAQRELGRLARFGHPASLILCDLDGFKGINDSLGHQAGDEALRGFARVLLSGTRQVDMVARWGGDEFVLLLPNCGAVSARIAAERLRKTVESTSLGLPGKLTASFGVAQAEETDTWDAWLGRADAAAYRAKRGGRNRVEIASRRSGAADSVALGCLQLVWRDAYACGNTTIDEQHEALFAHANELLNATLVGDEEQMRPLLESLITECSRHFADEERLLLWAGYSGIEEHAAAHGRLLDKARQLYQACFDGRTDLAEVISFVTRELVANHMLKEDRRHFPSLAALPSAS